VDGELTVDGQVAVLVARHVARIPLPESPFL
jgi:hypothetical protein